MTKIILPLILSIMVFLSACGGPGESKAEFDGGYMWTSSDKYVVLKEVKPYSTKIVKGRTSITSLMRAPKYYYILDSTPGAVLSSSDTQGIFIKGDYTFKDFSLHPLVEKQLSEKEGFFDNKGKATKENPFYYAGDSIKIDKKKDDDAGGYFFKVKNLLSPGKYVGWIGSSFWVFEIT